MERAFIAWCCMAKAKRSSDRWVANERGGAHVLVFGLLALLFAVALLLVSMNWMLQSSAKTKTKLALDQATQAAATNVDPIEAAYGRLVWDEEAGEADFYRYLAMNLRLDGQGRPTERSYAAAPPVVHLLEFVTSPTYPAVITRSVSVGAGGPQETTRNVQVTVYGPSVVAVVEVHQRLIGRDELESIVLPSVASVRFR